MKNRHAVSLAYWGRVAQEWLAKFPEWRVRRMLLEVVEYSEIHVVSDVEKIFEIARGQRVA